MLVIGGLELRDTRQTFRFGAIVSEGPRQQAKEAFDDGESQR